jgi:phosphonate transport system substrate-binding protein
MFTVARNKVLAAVCFLVSVALYGADKQITVALVFDGLTEADREPLRAYLTKVMGRPVNLAVPDVYTETVDGLADGSFDFACLGGLMYVRAHAKFGVIPVVRRSSDLQYHSVFIAGAGSSIDSLRDLRGKQFALGDINSTSTMIVYRELLQAGIDANTDVQLRYSGSHVATAALVESGVVDAGALDETIFASLIRGGKLNGDKVRVFHVSEPFAGYVYVAGKDVPEAVREKFVQALLALKEGKDDSVLRILRAKYFVVANDQEYANIRRIAHQRGIF